MNKTEKTYGTEFIEALDTALGRKLHTYAERKKIRTLDRSDMVTLVRPYGFDVLKIAKEGTPQELAEGLAGRLAVGNPQVDLMTPALLLMISSG